MMLDRSSAGPLPVLQEAVRAFPATWIIAALVLVTTALRGQVLINEFAYDDSGDDDEEFVELFHPGAAAIDISGWVLEAGDGTGARRDFPLAHGTTIEAGGYLVLGGPGVPDADVVLSTPEVFGNGPAYLLLRRQDGEVVDGVAYEANKGLEGFPQEALAEGAIWGNHVLVAGTRMSW